MPKLKKRQRFLLILFCIAEIFCFTSPVVAQEFSKKNPEAIATVRGKTANSKSSKKKKEEQILEYKRLIEEFNFLAQQSFQLSLNHSAAEQNHANMSRQYLSKTTIFLDKRDACKKKLAQLEKEKFDEIEKSDSQGDRLDTLFKQDITKKTLEEKIKKRLAEQKPTRNLLYNYHLSRKKFETGKILVNKTSTSLLESPSVSEKTANLTLQAYDLYFNTELDFN